MILRCQVCQAEIPEDRLKRKSGTCSIECMREVKRLRRDLLAVRRCRLCGRSFRSHPQKPATGNAGPSATQLPLVEI
jgi:hypothetical protein